MVKALHNSGTNDSRYIFRSSDSLIFDMIGRIMKPHKVDVVLLQKSKDDSKNLQEYFEYKSWEVNGH